MFVHIHIYIYIYICFYSWNPLEPWRAPVQQQHRCMSLLSEWCSWSRSSLHICFHVLKLQNNVCLANLLQEHNTQHHRVCKSNTLSMHMIGATWSSQSLIQNHVCIYIHVYIYIYIWMYIVIYGFGLHRGRHVKEPQGMKDWKIERFLWILREGW